MDDAETRLDGNSVAGLMTEVFAFDVTTAMVRCVGCGHADPLGAATVYSHAPGVIVRCRGCSGVLMRFAEIRDHVMVDMRGVEWLELTVN
ncbi:MAG TPA: DUF6510 family protein [Solirubrobacteraceae bacterium]|nr:DUF6510 family protein [Solirubrobacteraceae bacterium]